MLYFRIKKSTRKKIHAPVHDKRGHNLHKLFLYCFLFISVTVPLPELFAETTSPNKIEYDLYMNSRFNFNVLVPDNYKSDPPPENGDGLSFHSPDKKIEITAYGMYNTLFHTVEQAMNFSIESNKQYKFTLKILKDNFYVISGIYQNDIIYIKSIYNKEDDSFITIYIKYPISKKEEMDPIVTTCSKSLKIDQK
jgi:hypothetical protein